MRRATFISRRICWAAAAVVTVSVGAAVTVSAQQRVTNGNARDANNRIGSNGYNDSGGLGGGNRGMYTGLTGNDIVTGNVTAGKEFRGNVPYTDPRAFRQTTGRSNIDSFLRSSSGPGYDGNGGFSSNAIQARPYYSDARGVAPPAGFAQQGFSGSYVPAPQLTRTPGDLRLGNPINTDLTATPRPGELLLPGPVNNQNNNSLITASPLYGVRQWDPSQTADQQFLQGYTSLYGDTMERQALDPLSIRKMRDELTVPNMAPSPMGQTNQQNANEQNNSSNNNQQQLGQQQQEGQNAGDTNLARPLPSAMETPQATSIGGGTIGGNVAGTAAFSSGLSTGQSYSQSVANGMVPQQQRTTQYSALQDRLKKYYGENRTINDAEAAAKFNQEVRALRQEQEQAKAKQEARNQQIARDTAARARGQGQAQPGQPGEPGQPGQPGPPQTNANPPGHPGALTNPPGGPAGEGPGGPAIGRGIPGPTGLVQKNRPKPEQIGSLGTLVKAKGLAEVLQTAENLMRQGKFISALDQYDAAQQIAPNYAVTALGRANAELGASYYTRAENDLKLAFTQDPSLLQAQYDLRGLLGEDRLNFLTKDLKDVVNREKAKPGPVFLLAYIMYNTGNERLASGYLDLAEKRAGGNATFYRVVRSHWSLPDVEGAAPAPTTTPAQEELNK